MAATIKRTHQRTKRRPQSQIRSRVAQQYASKAKEINAAKQAMERVRKEVEFEPERLHYVISLSLL